jgi:predicted Zn-ribbon and HTH transcriptional regulator
MPTRRERIMDILEQADEPLTAEDLCQILDVRSRSIIYEDLDHVARSVRGKGLQLLVKPASCGKCLYVFSMRKSSKPPTRCPKCKSEWILAPSFIIRPK